MKLPVRVAVNTGRADGPWPPSLVDANGAHVELELAAKCLNRQAAADKLAEAVDILLDPSRNEVSDEDEAYILVRTALHAYRSAEVQE